MEIHLLLTFNISSLFKNMYVKLKLVIQFLNLEFAEYQKSPEKVKEPEPVPVPVDLGKEWNSRVRLYIWLQLRLLYESCVLGKKLTVN